MLATGPEAVLAYLSRYTHRVAISNSRLIALDDNGGRAENLARARRLLAMPAPELAPDDDQTVDRAGEPPTSPYPCPCCGGRMIVIETFEPGQNPRGHPPRAPPPRKAGRP